MSHHARSKINNGKDTRPAVTKYRQPDNVVNTQKLYTRWCNSLLVMKIVCLGWRQEGKVISAVWDCCWDQSQDEEQESRGKVGAHQQWAENWRQHVTEDVLDGMSVDWSDSDRSRPFVVNLVNPPIQVRVMKQAVKPHNKRCYHSSPTKTHQITAYIWINSAFHPSGVSKSSTGLSGWG